MNEQEHVDSLFIIADQRDEAKKVLRILQTAGVDVRVCLGRIEMIGLINLLEQYFDQRDAKTIKADLAKSEENLIRAYYQMHPDEQQNIYTKPYLKNGEELIIPYNCHGKYRYWLNSEETEWKPLNTALTLVEILACLDAPKTVIENYTNWKFKAFYSRLINP